jgi:hypothetical protein
MSDGVFIKFVCQVFNPMVIQVKICQRFICIVFVNIIPHNSNEDHVELDYILVCLGWQQARCAVLLLFGVGDQA